jgi:hypothetical protein
MVKWASDMLHCMLEDALVVIWRVVWLVVQAQQPDEGAVRLRSHATCAGNRNQNAVEISSVASNRKLVRTCDRGYCEYWGAHDFLGKQRGVAEIFGFPK